MARVCKFSIVKLCIVNFFFSVYRYDRLLLLELIMITTEQIKKKIEEFIQGADVVVEDLRGDQKHYGVDVVAEEFKDKSIIQQHQMIYDALGDAMRDNIHALRIKTSSR